MYKKHVPGYLLCTTDEILSQPINKKLDAQTEHLILSL